jgi:hypothetical protein
VSEKWFLIAWCAVAAAGCRQGLGERCQVNSDCVSGICSESAPKVCVSMSGQNDQIDATVPLDTASATSSAPTAPTSTP